MRSHAKAPSAGSNLRQAKGLRRHGLAFACLILLACIGIGASFAGAAQRAVLSTFGEGTAGTAGNFSSVGGMAVNTTGAGGVPAGTLYVGDTGGRRIQQLEADGSFVRTWGYDVVQSGEDNGAHEQQKLLVKASGGKFALSFESKTTGASGKGTWASGATTVTLESTSNGTFAAGQILTSTAAGIPVGTEILSVSGSTINISKATTAAAATGKNIEGHNLAYNAGAAEVETALNALSTIGAAGGSVSVTRAELSATEIEYTVTFGGALGGNDVPQLTATNAGLEGTKTATVTTSTPGGGIEVCQVGASPADVCKTGSSSAIAGAMSTPQGVAVDQSTGNVYVTDSGNDRVNVYSATGQFELAFGYDVVSSGPDDQVAVTRNERQRVRAFGNEGIGEEVHGGTFTLTFGGQTTAAIPWNATAAEVQSALAALSTIGVGNVAVYGPEKGPWTVEYTGTLANTDVAQMTGNGGALQGPTFPKVGVETLQPGGSSQALELCKAADVCKAGVSSGEAGGFASLVDSTPAVDPTTGNLYVPDQGNLRINEFKPTLDGSNVVTGVSFVRAFGWDVAPNAVDERQEIRVSATGGKFVLTLGSGGPGVSETAPISSTATPSEVESALNAIANVSTGGGSVTVSGGPGDAGATSPYVVSFPGGALHASDVAQLEAESVSGGEALSGGSPSSGVAVRTVANGHTVTVGLEACTQASVCQKGLVGNRDAVQFATESPGPIAVDFDGDVYAASLASGSASQCGTFNQGDCQVLKFTPDGESVARFGPGAGESTGNNCQLTYTSSSSSAEKSTTVGAFEVAIDPDPTHRDNHVLIAKKAGSEATYKVYEFDPDGGASKPASGKCTASPPAGTLEVKGTSMVRHGLAIGIAGQAYVANSQSAGGKIYLLGPFPPASAKMTSATPTGPTTATFAGTVTPPAEKNGQTFDTTWHFEYSTDQEDWTKVPSLDKDAGSVPSVPVPVGEEATGLKPNTKYFVRLCVTTSSPVCSSVLKFTTVSQAPSVVATYPEAASQAEATLVAQVNPNSLPSTYHFEWTSDQHWQETHISDPTHAYDHRIPVFERQLGGGDAVVYAEDTVSGLDPASVYHFRVVASNSAGTTNGPDQELETLNHCGLPDKRCYELVSPPDKGPAGVITTLFATGSFQTAPDGDSVAYSYLNPDEATTGGGLMYLGKRSEDGWSSSQLSPPSLVPIPANELLSDAPGSVRFNSPDLSCSIARTYSPLTADVPAIDVEYGMRNLFSRDAEGSWRLVTTSPVLNPQELAEAANLPAIPNVIGATPDCGRVYFTPGAYIYLPSATGLYESDEGAIRDAGLRPDGTKPPSATSNAVSQDGKLYFTATSDKPATNGKAAVFIRADGGPSVEITEKQGGANDSLGSRFGAASKDGGHVFFVSTYGLAPTSSTGPAEACNSFTAGVATACDLYDYETETGDLTDLTADSNVADTKGAVVQRVLVASEEGAAVYFSALGQLVPGKGKTYAQNTEASNASERTANVYLAKGGSLRFVINARDGVINGAKTGADGNYLLFTSTANLTGSEPGGHSQAYLYSSATGEIQCVSCRRDGQSASGLPSSTEGASQQFLSADGTVFFGTRDALAPGAAQGKINVYEWKHGQVFLLVAGQGKETSTGQEELYGATPGGDDVFLGSVLQLDPHDVDTVSDLYDARVGGGFAPPPTPPVPCDPAADQCQGSPATSPAAPSPASGASGPGNPPKSPSPPARCRKGTVRRHGRCVKPRKHKRAAAHKRATHTDRGGVK